MTSVAVVVPVAGRDRHLRWLRRGLAVQARPPDEVIVVQMDPTRPVDAAVSATSTVVALDGPAGKGLPLSRARNAGAGAAAAAGHDVVVFLDVDCVPGPDLTTTYATALAGGAPRLVGAPVRYLREGWSPTRPIGGVAWWANSTPAPARAHPAAGEPSRPAPADLFWSLSFAATPATWARVGGFDEDYVGYGAEDTDFARRAAAAGVELAFVGGGTAFHQWHPPSRFDQDGLDAMIANAHRFHRRWGEWPMTGWWDDLVARDLVRFQPERNVLERRS